MKKPKDTLFPDIIFKRIFKASFLERSKIYKNEHKKKWYH